MGIVDVVVSGRIADAVTVHRIWHSHKVKDTLSIKALTQLNLAAGVFHIAQQSYVPKVLYSDGSMFRRFYISKVLYSEI